MEKTVLGIFAHPDDAEFVCSGTLSLLNKAGWSVHIATMAPGDKGSATHSREELSEIRKEEANKSAQLIDGSYHCLEFEDVYILYNIDTINEATALIRRIRPQIVFTLSPADYMIDHEITSKIVQTACFSAGIKNMSVSEKPFEPVPYLYYCDPIEAKDKYGMPIKPALYVDVSREMLLREKMLLCHKSQRTWLSNHHKINDGYIDLMRRIAEQRGREINTGYAEGFRQHLGHGFPQDNILDKILGELVISEQVPALDQKQN